ncbi:hypothetical protein ACLUYJ_19265, partial [Acinetobacter baumannii]|uniref:hypothetical protein n=1 Tax=Acinetobacter baumannii TaxID=470 RepID=UPI00195F6241
PRGWVGAAEITVCYKREQVSDIAVFLAHHALLQRDSAERGTRLALHARIACLVRRDAGARGMSERAKRARNTQESQRIQALGAN